MAVPTISLTSDMETLAKKLAEAGDDAVINLMQSLFTEMHHRNFDSCYTLSPNAAEFWKTLIGKHTDKNG